jgi:uncharacterized protein (TIGR01777 family)
MNILITGGTGFVGSHLIEYLLVKGCNITILTRDKGNVTSGIRAIEDINEISQSERIDVIVNLAGAPISKRWSEKYKQELINSRVNTTKSTVALIKKLKNKPDVLISASAIGYYGSQDDTPLNEEAHPRNEFTHQLCKKWEAEALKAEKLGVRVCITRLGVVLGKNGGALKEMLPPFKIGLGGKIGSGKQYFSWVHIDDVISAFAFLVESKKQSGIYNLTTPNPVTNSEFTKALGKQLKRLTLFPMPAFVVKLLFGEMGETLLLNGQRVVPNKLKEAGFKFKYTKTDEALKDIIK